MTHWGWYWKIKKQHKPKSLCSCFMEIDSFSMFKNAELVRLVKESKDRISLMVPGYDLIATLQDNNSLDVRFKGGAYTIPVEQKPCYFGGFYYFFHCPACKARMRKLYCIQGVYLCRKCARLGYRSQRLRPSERCGYMMDKIEEKLKNSAGSLKQKPPWMGKGAFQKMRRLYVTYDEKKFMEIKKELFLQHGFEYDEWYWPQNGMEDAYVEREETKEEFF